MLFRCTVVTLTILFSPFVLLAEEGSHVPESEGLRGRAILTVKNEESTVNLTERPVWLVGATRQSTSRTKARSTAVKRPATKKRVKAGTARTRYASRRSRRPVAPPPPPLIPSNPFGVSALSADLFHLLGARAKTGNWGAIVTSVSNGDTLFQVNADAAMMPASTQKLFTTALAFERLGVHHQFSTDVLRDGPLNVNGTVEGSLVLRGGGDPAFSAKFLGGTPEGPARTLARRVAAAGVRRVSGDLIADASAFESRKIPEGWLSRYLNDSYAARVSALSMNENLLHVAVTPGTGGRAATITLRPALAGIKVINGTKTRARSGSARLAISRGADGAVVARGWIGSRSQTRVYTVVVDDPALFTARAFRRALEQEGIEVDGAIKLSPTPIAAHLIASVTSPPLYQLASIMNRESDNHYAELLLRNAARAGNDTIAGSATLARAQLGSLLGERAGTAATSVRIYDGSGLSSLNRITPRALTELLMYAHRAPWAKEFHLSLPVAGQSETLRRRMGSTAAQGNLHAKTGTTNDVVSLGGYVSSRSGELLAFSFFYNGRERAAARESIDAMGATLAGFSR